MYRAQRKYNRPHSVPTFRKDKISDMRIKCRENPRVKSLPQDGDEEKDNKMRFIKIRNKNPIPHDSMLWYSESDGVGMDPNPNKGKPVVAIKRPKFGVKQTFEEFKRNQWLKRLAKGGRLLTLPSEIVEMILGFTGIIENHNDYCIMKLGFHDTEYDTMKRYKKYVIHRLISSSDKDFVKNIKYLYENENFVVSYYANLQMQYFLNDIKLTERNQDIEERDEYIKFLIKWAKQTNRNYSTPILGHLLKESHHIFTRNLIKNMI
jgi:hypothetical protein